MSAGNLLTLMALAKYDLQDDSLDTRDVMRGMMYDAEYSVEENTNSKEYHNFEDVEVFDKFMFRVGKEVAKREISV